ncbi:MAG TPA: hypothetical protein DD381_03355 [Lentisphaeria bacterium]|nr:MAG: hypothetical protein A2X47_02895 [Lentisphaerae bacterium GWF2_38_69]HBM15369.1 hypothetical protein [Lentisphaeria bacterium]
MKNVTSLSVSGLRKLVIIAKKQHLINKTKPIIINPSESVKNLLHMSGIMTFFQLISMVS